MAMTPRSRAAAGSDASLLRAPRSLNELVTWRFSYLTNTSAPVRAESLGAASMGVRSTFPAIVRRAASMSAMVTLMSSASCLRAHPAIVATARRHCGNRRAGAVALKFLSLQPTTRLGTSNSKPHDDHKVLVFLRFRSSHRRVPHGLRTSESGRYRLLCG